MEDYRYVYDEGFIWALWHVPLYFIEGTYQAEEVGWFTQRFWIFMVGIIFQAVLYTWIFNNTGRSTLSAILFHFSGNAFGEAFALSDDAELYSLFVTMAAVALVVLIWKPATLTRQDPSPAGESSGPGGEQHMIE
jgi:hypothetical protein